MWSESWLDVDQAPLSSCVDTKTRHLSRLDGFLTELRAVPVLCRPGVPVCMWACIQDILQPRYFADTILPQRPAQGLGGGTYVCMPLCLRACVPACGRVSGPGRNGPCISLAAPHCRAACSMSECLNDCLRLCVHAYVYAHMRACIHACMRACMRACRCACRCACMHARVSAYIAVCMHMWDGVAGVGLAR